MVKINGLKASEVASLCYCDSRTVSGWVRSFDEDGLAGLKDRLRSGRPPRVALKKIRKIIAGEAASRRQGCSRTPYAKSMGWNTT